MKNKRGTKLCKCGSGKTVPLNNQYCSPDCPARRRHRPEWKEKYFREYYITHREECLERTRRSQVKRTPHGRHAEYIKHKETYKKSGRRSYLKNREARIAAATLWRRNNREKWLIMARSRQARRRSRKLSALGSASTAEVIARFDFFGWRCRYCGKSLNNKTVTIDHQIPLSRGGTNWPSNLVPSCRSCNCSKGTQTFREFVIYSAGTTARRESEAEQSSGRRDKRRPQARLR
ncbi:MAG: HNH endonuclease [Patescibacteria group bacterium]|nr:HNH endonuclease [Patescibacteria group bacterium]